MENAVPPLRERRRLLGTLLALAVTALGYAVLLHAAPFRPLTLPPAVRSLASLAAAALCWSYCRTNLHSLSVRWAALSGRARHLGAARGALTALVLLPLGLLPGGTSLVLLGPGTATAALFLVVLAAALSRRHPLPDRAEPPSSTASTASTESSASSLSTSRTSRTSHSPYLPSISRTS
ncbi:hypothetical protein [Actinacidiphila yeochonensis]|uniref:hypothetical protein n=1 Tax=Actinacidiphila yeochonensis TaxID=89050 RepID=UPI00055E3E05|nr:hypothetical protein [Actinacidiphila yeochonensis]